MSADVVIHDNHVKAFGIKYFRGNAPSISIGTVGDKEKSIVNANYLTNEDRVPVAKLKISKAFSLSLASTNVSEKDLGGSIRVPGLGSLGAGTVTRQLNDRSLKLVQFEVLPKDLVAAANASPQVIETLKRIGNDGRLVHKIIVIMDAKTATVVDKSSNVDLKATVKGVTVTLGGGSGSTTLTTVDLSDCTFAYLLLKPKWDANMKKNWKRIEDWEQDDWGLT